MKTVVEFAGETGVFGLNLFRSNVAKAERLFWIGLTIAFITFTLNDVRKIIKTYYDEDILTSVAISDNVSIISNRPISIKIEMRKFFIPPNNFSNYEILDILYETFSNTTHPETIPDSLFYLNILLFNYISWS